VKQIWTGRMAQAAGKYGEHAPMATVCCNACRTCITSNLVGVLSGGLVAVALATRRFAARLVRA
jgi:hypothetical protein